MAKIYKTIDLFSGIGGIRKGYEMTGRFKNVLSADIDKFACKVYKHLYNEDSFNDVTSDEFKEKVKKIDYDILLGGFPCQAFSIAGLQKGFADETRGTLFFDIADILKKTKPKAFMLENVEGLLKHDKGNTFKTIVKVLNELDYKIVGIDIKDGIINYEAKNLIRTTKDFGIPQKRARIFIMGFILPSAFHESCGRWGLPWQPHAGQHCQYGCKSVWWRGLHAPVPPAEHGYPRRFSASG